MKPMYQYRFRMNHFPLTKFYCTKACHSQSMQKDPMKKTRTRDAKKRSLQTLVNKYARLRDCFGNGGTNCISCGVWYPFEKGDGGHFIPTTSGAVRFDERNVNFQCHRCNRFLHGNVRHYYKAMIQKYGPQVVAELEAQEFTPKKWTDDELTALRTYYRGKIKSIEAGIAPEPLTKR